MFSDLRARSLPPLRRRRPLLPAVLGAGLLAVPVLLRGTPAAAQQAGYGQTLGTTPMERQLYDSGSGRSNSGSILDSTNPIDLMNKIRRGTAMDDATPPASAIDQALQQLEIQSKPAPMAPPASQAAAGVVSEAPQRPAATTPVWSQPASPAGMPAPSGSTTLRPAL